MPPLATGSTDSTLRRRCNCIQQLVPPIPLPRHRIAQFAEESGRAGAWFPAGDCGSGGQPGQHRFARQIARLVGQIEREIERMDVNDLEPGVKKTASWSAKRQLLGSSNECRLPKIRASERCRSNGAAARGPAANRDKDCCRRLCPPRERQRNMRAVDESVRPRNTGAGGEIQAVTDHLGRRHAVVEPGRKLG